MTEDMVVQLTTGAVRGLCHEGWCSFRGIPYAAPPVGERRWRAPAPVAVWSGVRDATRPANPAPQPAQSPAEADSVDEDCLTLDVTLPESAGSGRPVVVWLHGGGGTNGAGDSRDPHRFARTGDVIVVTPNYRLGVLACFGYPGLQDSGTFGLQDHQAVLRWVQREVPRFGGDPGNVTLAGESYGALMLAAHLTSPRSQGLFHRAILQSPFAVLGPTPAHTFIPGVPELPPRWVAQDELRTLGEATAVERGWVRSGSDPVEALDELRQVPVAELLGVSNTFIRPAFGGPVLPESPAAAILARRFHRVPALLGGTSDEAAYFVDALAELMGTPVTTETYPKLLVEAFGDDADVVAARYPLDRFPSPSRAWARLSTDRAWAWPTWELGRTLAEATPTWRYEFADPGAPPPVPLPGLSAGAQHASELAYQFDVPWNVPLSAPQRELGELINRYWTGFARTGSPARDDLPPWPRADTGHVQRLTPGQVGGVDFAAEHLLDLWAAMP